MLATNLRLKHCKISINWCVYNYLSFAKDFTWSPWVWIISNITYNDLVSVGIFVGICVNPGWLVHWIILDWGKHRHATGCWSVHQEA